jgi:hypothetical protein
MPASKQGLAVQSDSCGLSFVFHWWSGENVWPDLVREHSRQCGNANSVARRHALPSTDCGMAEAKRLGDFHNTACFLNDGFRFHERMLQKTT